MINTKIANEVGKVVVESWKSEDGTSWYRKWSDGWIEQGGTLPTIGTEYTLNFPTSFSNTYYSICKNLGGGAAYAPKDQTVGFYSLTETSAKTMQSTNYITPSYYACGY